MPNKILVIRSARENLLAYTCRLLRRRYPDTELTVLAQDQYRERTEELVAPVDFIPYPGARFAARELTGEDVARLSKARFSEVVILYHNRDGKGYEQVHAMVRKFHRGAVGVVNADGRYENYDRWRFDDFIAGVLTVLAAARGAVAALLYSGVPKKE